MAENVVDIDMTVSFLAKLCLSNENNSRIEVHALINTGAANSLLHESVVRKYKIPYEPVSLRLWF